MSDSVVFMFGSGDVWELECEVPSKYALLRAILSHVCDEDYWIRVDDPSVFGEPRLFFRAFDGESLGKIRWVRA